MNDDASIGIVEPQFFTFADSPNEMELDCGRKLGPITIGYETYGKLNAMDTARRLSQDEGIISGISCGAATAVALRLAAQDEYAGKNIVVILPDSGERYLSTPLYTQS